MAAVGQSKLLAAILGATMADCHVQVSRAMQGPRWLALDAGKLPGAVADGEERRRRRRRKLARRKITQVLGHATATPTLNHSP